MASKILKVERVALETQDVNLVNELYASGEWNKPSVMRRNGSDVWAMTRRTERVKA